MLVYAVRHAESRANLDAAEGLNSPLSPLGEQQTSRLAKRLAVVRLGAIYSSPLQRCIETALPVARAANLAIRVRSDLWEYHRLPPGTEARMAIDPPARLIASNPRLSACPDGLAPAAWPMLDETFDEMLGRIRRFAAYLKARWTAEEDTVLVLSHGTPIARLIEAWLTDLPGPSFRFVIDNAAVTALRFAGGVSSLVCLNEISHLTGLAAPRSANYVAGGAIRPEPPAMYW